MLMLQAARDPSWIHAWVMHCAGEGTKAVRRYEWSRLPLGAGASGWEGWLLFRRRLKDPAKRAYYFFHAPAGTTLPNLLA